jgi:50S ribosome-binding GTPase
MTEPDLLALAERLEALAMERTLGPIVGEESRRRAARLHDHLTGHVLPRARSLEAPILVLLLGPTGAGKSSLINGLVQRPVSPSGLLRPTTREVVAVVGPAERDALLAKGAPLPSLAAARLRVVTEEGAPSGIALVDAPDVDSIEHANRELTDRLAEAADLGIFVTTATRYADRVPWDVLLRARDRGLPLVIVVNRVPVHSADREIVMRDVDRLLGEFGVDPGGLDGIVDGTRPDAANPAPPHGLQVLAIPEGSVDDRHDGMSADAVAPLRARIDSLGRDREARRALAARALAGSLAGLAPLLERVADDAEHEAIEADALRRSARTAFDGELRSLSGDLARGTFLRAEALRQWQQFVGADEVTRLFSTGIGKVRGTLSAVIRGTPRAPVAEVREDALADILAVARSHAAEAARRTAADWADEAGTRDAIADDPSLWGPSRGFDERLAGRLEGWVEAIAEDVRATGGGKKRLARGASVGVNAAGIGVMLATFAHTGGLTGAEIGVAAAAGFLNQRLLEALFGEAALVEMIDRARARLREALVETFEEELGRYHRLVPDGAGMRDLAGRLRSGAMEVGSLKTSTGLALRRASNEAPAVGAR